MQYDVVVVGASISGLQAARKLAAAGIQVALFDRQKTIDPARRTLIVTPEIRNVLSDFPEQAALHSTSIMRLCVGGTVNEVHLEKPDVVIERATLIRWMVDRAKDAGVELFTGFTFESLSRSRNAVDLCFRNDTCTVVTATKAVIGADGICGRVATSVGLAPVSTAPIVQAEVELPKNWNPDVTQVWFDLETTPFFYWLIPESETRAAVGLIQRQGRRIRLELDKILDRHKLEPLGYQGARVAMYRPGFRTLKMCGNVPVYLVGDAAAQVKVTTVGGVVTGLMGADAAVMSLIKNTDYEAELRRLRTELQVHWVLRWLLERLDAKAYDNLVSLLSSRLNRFLRCYNRDHMGSAAWKLPLVEPRLITLMLSALTRALARYLGRVAIRVVPTNVTDLAMDED